MVSVPKPLPVPLPEFAPDHRDGDPTLRGGLREAKKHATTRALVQAARRLVHRDGLDAVTVEEIAAEAGVSGRTFFNYFDSKERAVLGPDFALGSDLARATFLAGGLNDGDLLADIDDLVGVEQLVERETRESLRLAFEIASREPKVFTAHLALIHQHEQELADLIARRRGEPVTGPEDRSTAALALAVIGRASFAWLVDEDGSTYRRHFEATRAVAARLFHHP